MMTKRRHTILLIAVILGLASAFSVATVALSQSNASAPRGPYMIAGGDRMMVWRIDQATGKVSYCMRDTNSTDPKFIAVRGPYCSAWSE